MENGYTYRLETPSDYDATEMLTRDAFWNVYQPGCDEHFIVHRMRGNPAVVEHLNYVCLDGGVICGHIFYTRTKVVSDDGRFFNRSVIWPSERCTRPSAQRDWFLPDPHDYENSCRRWIYRSADYRKSEVLSSVWVSARC